MPTDSLHPDQAQPLYVTIPQDEYDRLCKVDKEWKETVEAFQKAVMPMKPYYPDKFCPRCGKPLDDKRWRKFSEEKPKEKQWILVYYPNHSSYTTGVEMRRWDDGCKYDVEVQEVYDKWMPLPSAPKEDI